MASFTAGTTFVDGVSNDVTAAKLGALVTNATPTSGFIQDRTAETVTATNDTLLIGDASDSNNLKRITVANFAQTLPTAKVTTGTIDTGTFGTTTSTAATITTGTIPTLTAGTTTSTAATITTGTIPTLVATTLVTTGTGTAAAPAIVPTGDTNTGIFFPAADTIAFAEGGAEAMRINSSGNVGIGTDTPTFKFVAANSGTDGGWLYSTGATSVLGIGGYSSADSAAFKLKYDRTSGNLTFNAGTRDTDTERLRIDSSGNVGIGTTSPSSYGKLAVVSSDNTEATVIESLISNNLSAKLKLGFNRVVGDNTTAANASLDLGVTSYPQAIHLDSSGNVGIGTTSPANKISVESSGANSSEIDISLVSGTGNKECIVNFGKNLATNDRFLGRIFYQVDNNVMGFNTNNTERLRIDSSGNCSIGTATALSTLHVHGNVTLSNTTTATSAGTGGLSKPATYAGYLTVSINGTSRKIPYYAT